MATATKSSKKLRPVWTKKAFPLTVAVFEFPSGTNETAPNYSVKLTRSFKRDESSEWESSDYLGAGDLLRGAKLLEAADLFILARLESDYQSRKAERNDVDGNDEF